MTKPNEEKGYLPVTSLLWDALRQAVRAVRLPRPLLPAARGFSAVVAWGCTCFPHRHTQSGSTCATHPTSQFQDPRRLWNDFRGKGEIRECTCGSHIWKMSGWVVFSFRQLLLPRGRRPPPPETCGDLSRAQATPGSSHEGVSALGAAALD